MSKIKILRIIARLNIGGPAQHVILLTAGLDKNRFESLLASGNPGPEEGDMSYFARSNGVSPHIIPQLRREVSFLDDLRALIRIYRLIKKEHPRILHTHTAKAGCLGRTAAVIFNLLHPKKKIKIVHTFHGHVFESYFSRFKTSVFILIEKILSFFTDKIITLSPSIKSDLVSYGISSGRKIEVISLGFDLQRLVNLSPRNEPSVNIGIVGRLVPVKNHIMFLKAAHLAINECKDMDLKFKVVGDGELRQKLEKYAFDCGCRGYVIFSGWQKDIADVYAGLDIVALSSLNEGTPVSLIEAMAAGKAIVSTDVGGVKDLLGEQVTAVSPSGKFTVLERGIIVRSSDTEGFASALVYLSRNKRLRDKMGSSGREFASRQFSRARLVKDIENLYSSILL